LASCHRGFAAASRLPVEMRDIWLSSWMCKTYKIITNLDIASELSGSVCFFTGKPANGKSSQYCDDNGRYLAIPDIALSNDIPGKPANRQTG